MAEQSARGTCLVCNVDSETVPLLVLEYRGAQVRICPRHLPLMIHDPGRLAGLIPGAEGWAPAEHHD